MDLSTLLSSDLIKSGIGAVLGFTLAQIVNIAKVAHDWFTRPRLVIEPINSEYRILSHSTQVNNGEWYEEEIYGFYVRNRGRRIATGVRFHLLKVEYKKSSNPELALASDSSFELATYTQSDSLRGATQTILVPGAAALVNLAWWREDFDAALPSVREIPDYYHETCEGHDVFRFTVVAFDDSARFVTKALTVQTRPHRAKRYKAQTVFAAETELG